MDMLPPSPNEASDVKLRANRDRTMAYYCKCEQKISHCGMTPIAINMPLIPGAGRGGLSCGPNSADDDDMQPSRPMSAEEQRLLDIG